MAKNSMKALRQTVDLSAYPDLVVVYLGMTVNMLTGVKTLFGFGPKIEGSVAARPDGLLLHENIFYSLFPLHVGMRQYWRDFESLERFTGAEPHREWWKQFLQDTGGTGFWHELYSARGGFEAIYTDALVLPNILHCPRHKIGRIVSLPPVSCEPGILGNKMK